MDDIVLKMTVFVYISKYNTFICIRLLNYFENLITLTLLKILITNRYTYVHIIRFNMPYGNFHMRLKDMIINCSIVNSFALKVEIFRNPIFM